MTSKDSKTDTNADKPTLSIADKVAAENAATTAQLPPNQLHSDMQSPDQRRATEAVAERQPDPGPRQRHAMEVVDIIVRKHGYGSKDIPGSGIAFLLRRIAAQEGIQADAFNAKIDDDAD